MDKMNQSRVTCKMGRPFKRVVVIIYFRSDKRSKLVVRRIKGVNSRDILGWSSRDLKIN